MADNSKIEWTDATWNPITGCSVTSGGCRLCYAMKLAGGRLKNHPSRAGLTIDTKNGPVWTGEVRLNHEWLDQPIRWGRQRQVFVCAHSDLFHPDVPDDWIDTIMGVMWACLYGRNEQDGHIFQVLTKRAQRMRDYFSTDRREAWARAAVNHGGGTDPDGIWDQVMNFDGPHPRIWLGVSVEDQAAADERVPLLMDTPAAVRWVSCEPQLGEIDLARWLNPVGVQCKDVCPDSFYVIADEIETVKDGEETVPLCPHCGERAGWTAYDRGIDWVVQGFESGIGARPGLPAWARVLRDQCAAAGVPYLFKQWGEWAPGEVAGPNERAIDAAYWFNGKWDIRRVGKAREDDHIDDEPDMFLAGKKAAGRTLDGVIHDGYPA